MFDFWTLAKYTC